MMVAKTLSKGIKNKQVIKGKFLASSWIFLVNLTFYCELQFFLLPLKHLIYCQLSERANSCFSRPATSSYFIFFPVFSALSLFFVPFCIQITVIREKYQTRSPTGQRCKVLKISPCDVSQQDPFHHYEIIAGNHSFLPMTPDNNI